MPRNPRKIKDSSAPENPDGVPAGAKNIDEILREFRPAMRACAFALTNGNPHAVDEILQECALHVWEQKNFPVPEKLHAWLMRIVYFKALSYRRDRARERLIGFSPELMERIADGATERFAGIDERHGALEACVRKLPASDSRLIRAYYGDNLPFKKISEIFQKTENSLWQQLFRLRRALRHCVEKTLENTKD